MLAAGWQPTSACLLAHFVRCAGKPSWLPAVRANALTLTGDRGII